MGGHESKQEVDISTTVVTDATLNVTQGCMSVMAGDQVMAVHGNGNVFTDNTQDQSMSIDMNCIDQMQQSNQFSSKINSSITQTLSDSEVALTEWMDPSSDTQTASVANNVTTNVTFDDTQNCMLSMSGTQIMGVSGDANLYAGNAQDQSEEITTTCLMSGGQYSTVVNNLTNTANQHSIYDSENPLAFIPDAIQATITSATAILAVMFIVITILVLVFMAGRRKRKRKTVTLPEPSLAEPPVPA